MLWLLVLVLCCCRSLRLDLCLKQPGECFRLAGWDNPQLNTRLSIVLCIGSCTTCCLLPLPLSAACTHQ